MGLLSWRRRIRPGTDDLVAEAIRRATELHHEGAHGDALATLERVADQAGEHPRLLNVMGLVLVQLERYEEAVAAYQRAVKARPDYAAAINNLGVAYAKQNRLDWAIAQFKRALLIDPAYEEAHKNLGLSSRQDHPDWSVEDARRHRNDWAIGQFQQAKKRRGTGLFSRFRSRTGRLVHTDEL